MKKLSFLMAVILMLTGSVFAFDVSADEVPATESVSAYTTSNKWIWSSSTVTTNSISYFRHDYDLDAAPVSMKVRVSAHNHLKFYVNGNIVTGYVTPAPAVVPQNIYYLDYEFTGDKLAALLGSEPTELALAAEVQYMGRGGGNYMNAKPALFAEVTLTYADNSSEILYTDTTWRALSDTPFVNGLEPMSTRNMNMQLDYDARKMPDKLAWTKYGYDESTYTAGTWTNAVAADASTANYKMRHQAIPEGVIHESITPVSAGYQAVGHQVFDTGRIVSGFVKFKLSAPAGTRVTIRYGESIDGNGKVIHRVADETNENYFDAYTFSGNGVEEFVTDFDYKAFRYFEIVGMPTDVSASDFRVEWASTGVEHTASFTSSNDALNKIYEACVNTQINNILGMPTDCPHREQSQYIADSQIQYDFISYAISNAGDLMYKTLLDFAGQQFDEGIFAFISPSSSYASLNSMHIPEWDLRYADILLTYYKTTGDLVGTREFYDNAVANAEYWAKGIDESGLVRQDYGHGSIWHISDHPGPQVAHTGDYYTVQNLLMYDTFNDISKIAAILGKTEDSELYATKAASLKSAINANLLNNETGLYLDSSGATASNPGVTSMAINVGVSPDYLIPAQLDYIAESAHTTNVVLTWEVFNALLNYGAAEEKQEVYDRIIEIYTKMGAYGTVWESVWNTNASHSHAWNAFPAKMLHSDFLGVKYAGVGYTDIEIKPYLPTNLSSMSGSLKLPETRGDIEVSLSRANNILTVAVDTPESALIAVPRVGSGSTLIKAGDTVIFENGTGKSASGLAYVSNDAEYVYYNANAGTYSITSESVMSSASEFAVDISTTVGGKITVNGGAAVKEYGNTHSLNSVLTIVAKPDAGYKFTGFSGSHGGTEAELRLPVTSPVDITANFERHDDIVRYIHIDAPIDGGFKVDFAGKTVEVPGVVEVLATEDAIITVTESADSNYEFAAWSGDIYSAKKIITIEAGEDDVNLTVVPSFKGLAPVADGDEEAEAVNLALGATVTTNNEYVQGTKWTAANLTDGLKTKSQVASKHGLTSNAYNTQDISATPHEIIIDLGSNEYMDTVIVWPRVDNVDAGAENDCFPTDFTISVMEDGGSTYTTVGTVTDQANPCGEGVEVDLGSVVKGRYVKMLSTGLGKGTVESGSTYYRVQLAEIEVFCYGETPDDGAEKTLKINGNGSVIVNGEELTLPVIKSYATGTKLAVVPTADTKYIFNKWSGDTTSTQVPLYLTMENDISLTANYGRSVYAVSGNLALTATASAPASLTTTSGTTWRIENINDGNTTNGGGYTSVPYSRDDQLADGSLYIQFDFAKNTDIGRVTLHPRKGATGVNGGSACFPTAVKIQYCLDGSSTWIDAASFTGIENPAGNAVNLDFDPVNARYIRVVPTAMGDAPSDASWENRIQFSEIEVYATNFMTENLAPNATSITATGDKYPIDNTNWKISYLVDGLTAKSGSVNGYTSGALDASTIATTPFYITFEFAEAITANEMVLYPRSDVKDASGKTPNFPLTYDVEAYNADSGEYETVFSVVNADNPAGKPAYCLFNKTVTTTKLRYVAKGVGTYPTDEQVYRAQFCEIKIGLVEASNVSGEVDITVTPETIVLADVDDVKSVSAAATGAKENVFVFSAEDEMGFPADFAELKITGDTTAEASVYGGGTGYLVVRLAENPQYAAKIRLASAIETDYLVGDVDDSGTVNVIDAIILSRNIADWNGYGDDTINVDAADIDFDGELSPADVTKLARHLANWKGYETLPIVD